MSLNKVRWGILGTSFISQQMAQAIVDSSSGELIAIGSRNLDTAKQFAQQFDVNRAYENYEELLSDPTIDVIYIGLPNHLHKEWTMRCLQSGKHVLCEKPFALNEGEVEEMTATAQSTQLFCMEALMYRCHPLINQLKNILHEGLLGKVQLYQATYTAKIADLANPVAGGAIYNLGCYPLSLITYLSLSQPVELKGLTVANNLHPNNDTRAIAMIRFEDLSLASISVSDGLEMSWQFTMMGSRGRLEMITNPWFPEVGDQIIRLHLNGESDFRDIIVTSHLSAYAYQINTVNNHIIDPEHQMVERVTLMESLANIKLLKRWRDGGEPLIKGQSPSLYETT